MQTTPATIDRGRRHHENPQADRRINHERCNGVRDRTPRNHDDHQGGRAIRIALRREMPEPKQTLPDSTYRLTPESVPRFADIVLIEMQDDAAFFANEQDEDGVRYASRIQTWIELHAGDARQRETAKDLY